jgi:hypothetical protein
MFLNHKSPSHHLGVLDILCVEEVKSEDDTDSSLVP